MQAATAPNMEVHVVGQPDAKRIQKDDYVRFTGTLHRVFAVSFPADLGQCQGQS